LAVDRLSQLSAAELEDHLSADYLDQTSGQALPYGSVFDEAVQAFLLRHFVEVVLLGVSNVALETHLSACMGRPVAVVGSEPPLEACPCCGFLTLSQRGEYDICPVCSWEDDGKGAQDQSLYSPPNGASLQNFRVHARDRIDSRGRWYRRVRMPDGQPD
jgi:hypothetical protein